MNDAWSGDLTADSEGQLRRNVSTLFMCGMLKICLQRRQSPILFEGDQKCVTVSTMGCRLSQSLSWPSHPSPQPQCSSLPLFPSHLISTGSTGRINLMTFNNTYEMGPWYSSMSGDGETCKILVGPDCYGEEGGVKDTMTPQIHMAMIIACIHLAAVPFNFLRKISVLYPLDPLSLPQARLGSFNAFKLRIFTAACFFRAVIITHNSLDKIGSKIIVISQLIECFARASCCRMACLLFDMTIYVQQFVENRQWMNHEIALGQHMDKTGYRKEAAVKIEKANALKLPSYLNTAPTEAGFPRLHPKLPRWSTWSPWPPCCSLRRSIQLVWPGMLRTFYRVW